jgi:ABC-2 type transport system ATP-binding protein
MSETAVAVRGLTKVFKVPFKKERIVAVRDLDLTVEAGQVYGLLGPNGSGKSTTLKIILGLVSAAPGSTEIFGRPSREVASRSAVGFLPENPYFYEFLTGAETLRFHGKLCGFDIRELKSFYHRCHGLRLFHWASASYGARILVAGKQRRLDHARISRFRRAFFPRSTVV